MSVCDTIDSIFDKNNTAINVNYSNELVLNKVNISNCEKIGLLSTNSILSLSNSILYNNETGGVLERCNYLIENNYFVNNSDRALNINRYLNTDILSTIKNNYFKNNGFAIRLGTIIRSLLIEKNEFENGIC